MEPNNNDNKEFKPYYYPQIRYAVRKPWYRRAFEFVFVYWFGLR